MCQRDAIYGNVYEIQSEFKYYYFLIFQTRASKILCRNILSSIMLIFINYNMVTLNFQLFELIYICNAIFVLLYYIKHYECNSNSQIQRMQRYRVNNSLQKPILQWEQRMPRKKSILKDKQTINMNYFLHKSIIYQQ